MNQFRSVIIAGIISFILMMISTGCYEVHYFPGKVTFPAEGGEKIIRNRESSIVSMSFLLPDGSDKRKPVITNPDGTKEYPVPRDSMWLISDLEWVKATVCENGMAIRFEVQPNTGKKRKAPLDIGFEPEFQVITIEQKGAK